MKIHQVIRQEREKRGWSQTELAERAGAQQQAVDRIESGSNSKYLGAVLDALGINSKGHPINASAVDIPLPLLRPQATEVREEPQFLGRLDLPVYAAVEGGPGELVVSTDAIDMVRRPWFLERVTDAYAVVVTGESMEPVYEAGDLVLVNPRLPPIKNKDAIFVSERFGGDFKASIKRYLGATDEHWLAKQFTPPAGQKAEVRFAKKEWHAALRVVGRYIP